MTRYSSAMQRAARDRPGLAQAQRKLSLTGGSLPDEVLAAQARLNSEQQAVSSALRTRDYAAGEQSLRVIEETLTIIESFLAKSGIQR